MKYDFNNAQTFADLEELAIDVQLDYSGFPPGEYKYFSLLTRLGYLNRHKGWTKETCELKQQEFRQDYQAYVRERDEWLNHARTVQRRIIRTTELSRKLNFSRSKTEALSIALELIENLVEEPNLAERINNNIKE
jgi:hypothetical protein